MRRLPVAALALIALALFSVPGLAAAQVKATPSGVFAICVRQADGSCVIVDAAGHGWPTTPAAGGATTATETNVNASASPVTVLAANTARIGATVYNDSTSVAYLLLGTQTASSTLYTVQLQPGAYYEAPFGFTGKIAGIWVSATGTARVTEVTP